jgi:hypothetical protein
MSTVSYIISLLVPGEELKFVRVEPEGLTEEFNECASWQDINDAIGYRDALMEGFKAQGYRTATPEDNLGTVEDPLANTVMFTVLRHTLEPIRTSHLIKDGVH